MDLHFDDTNDFSLKRFERMLKTNSIYFFDSSDFEKIIVYYIDHGKISLAKKAIELALNQHPMISEIRVLKAEVHILESEFQEADKILEELMLLDPNDEEIYIQKAMLMSKQDKHPEAIKYLEIAMQLSEDEDNLDVLTLIGMEYLYLEKFEQALNFFTKILSIESKDQTTLYNVVYCFDMLDQNQGAIDFLVQYIEKEPYSETAWHQLGREYYILENFTKALESFDYALLIDEKFMGAYMEKAKTLEKLSRFSEAIHFYLLTTKMEDPSAYAYLKIGHCYEQMNQPQQAIHYYLKSSEQDPYLEKPLMAMVALYNKQEKYQKSLSIINQLLDINDEDTFYWKQYGVVNMKIAFFSEAIKAFEKCLLLKDHSLDLFLNLSDAYLFLGDFKNAIKTLIHAETYYHNYYQINYRLSGLYFHINSIDFALKHFDLFMKNDATKYKLFQQLFPTLHNNKNIFNLLKEKGFF